MNSLSKSEYSRSISTIRSSKKTNRKVQGIDIQIERGSHTSNFDFQILSQKV